LLVIALLASRGTVGVHSSGRIREIAGQYASLRYVVFSRYIGRLVINDTKLTFVLDLEIGKNT